MAWKEGTSKLNQKVLPIQIRPTLIRKYLSFSLFLHITYLGLNADLYEGAGNGEQITDDEQDVPAIDELHPVPPTHWAFQFVFKVLYKLLDKESIRISHKFKSIMFIS